MSAHTIVPGLFPAVVLLGACSAPLTQPEQAPESPPALPAPPESRPRTQEPAPQPSTRVGADVVLTLEQALDLALREHPQLDEARAAVAAAQVEARRMRRYPDPTLVGRVEGARLGGDTFDDAEVLLGLVQTIPLGGRLETAGRAADLEGEARVQDARAALMRIRRDVQGAFSAALYAQQVVELQVELVGDIEQGLAVVRARVEAGDAVQADVLLVELDLAEARRQLKRAVRLSSRARLELAAAMGLPALSIASVEGALDASLELPALEALVRRIEEDPSLLAARARSDAAAARLELAEAERIPDLNLELLYRRIVPLDQNAFDLGVGVRLPLSGASRDRVLEGGHQLARARAQERAAHNDVERAIRAAHQGVLGALDELEFAEREVLPRAEALDATLRTRFELGDATRTELLEGRVPGSRRAWPPWRLAARCSRPGPTSARTCARKRGEHGPSPCDTTSNTMGDPPMAPDRAWARVEGPWRDTRRGCPFEVVGWRG